MKTYTFDHIVDSQEFNHDQRFVLFEEVATLEAKIAQFERYEKRLVIAANVDEQRIANLEDQLQKPCKGCGL